MAFVAALICQVGDEFWKCLLLIITQEVPGPVSGPVTHIASTAPPLPLHCIHSLSALANVCATKTWNPLLWHLQSLTQNVRSHYRVNETRMPNSEKKNNVYVLCSVGFVRMLRAVSFQRSQCARFLHDVQKIFVSVNDIPNLLTDSSTLAYYSVRLWAPAQKAIFIYKK